MTKGEYLLKKGIKYLSNINPAEETDEEFMELVDVLVGIFDEIYESEEE